MYRIDSRGATADGRFTEGNPTTGTPATVVNAAWMNAVQDELVNVVQGAGLTLVKADSDQLLEAINILAKAQAQTLYPVGSLYMNASDDRNPNLIFGFGTWVKVSGRFIVGQDSSDTDFDTGAETGGSKTHNHGGATGDTALTIAQMPSHDHMLPEGGADYAVYGAANGQPNVTVEDFSSSVTSVKRSLTSDTGGGEAHNHAIGSASNLPPYFVAYIWRRTA